MRREPWRAPWLLTLWLRPKRRFVRWRKEQAIEAQDFALAAQWRAEERSISLRLRGFES